LAMICAFNSGRKGAEVTAGCEIRHTTNGGS
jgi:hypothetical protein